MSFWTPTWKLGRRTMSDKTKLRTYLKVLINLSIILVMILLFIFVVPRLVVYFMPLWWDGLLP